eukprot:3376120-Pyramimonas_sp.AAC.1
MPRVALPFDAGTRPRQQTIERTNTLLTIWLSRRPEYALHLDRPVLAQLLLEPVGVDPRSQGDEVVAVERRAHVAHGVPEDTRRTPALTEP